MGRLIFLLFLLSLALPVFGERSGILYFAQGGSGGGSVHLLTSGRLFILNWRKGELKETGLDRPEGWRHGAIWHFEQEEGYLLKARFEGKFNAEVKDAIRVVTRHFGQLGRGEFDQAYSNLSVAWRKQQSRENFHKSQAKISYNPGEAPTYALKVIGHNSKEVLILVDAHWFVPADNNYYRYTLVRQEGDFRIDRVEKISAQDFLHS